MTRWEKNLALFDELVDMNPNFERKGKTMPYTSANGYMFSLLNKEGDFGIRLSKDSGKKFLEEHESGPLKSHGATMQGYVLIPDDMLENPESLLPVLQEAYDFVMGLPPK